MACQRCNSSRLVKVVAKAAGTKRFEFYDFEFEELDIPNLCEGDYLRFLYCLVCGQVQGSFPTPPLEVEIRADIDNGFGEDG